MSVTRPAPLPVARVEPSTALIAKAALKRLATQRLEPTPENYERAYRHEAGDTGESGDALATLIERIVRGIERGGQNWTAARRKEGIQRVLAAGRGDPRRLQQRLSQLVNSWDSDGAAMPVGGGDGAATATRPAPLDGGYATKPAPLDGARATKPTPLDGARATMPTPLDGAHATKPPPLGAARASRPLPLGGAHAGRRTPLDAASPAAAPDGADEAMTMGGPATPALLDALGPAANAELLEGIRLEPPPKPPLAWERVARTFAHALRQALPDGDGANHRELVDDLARVAARIEAEGATVELAGQAEAVARRAERVVQHRHHLFAQLGKLCRELTGSLADIAEDGSWVKGQCEAMQLKVEEGLSARGVRAVSDMLHHARKQHATVRGEREQAREALKSLITQMLAELAELGSKTGSFHDNVGRYAEVIERSDSLEGLTGVVREMVVESRNVQAVVQQTQERLQQEHSKASDLSERVSKLENEMRRLSDEVSTDQLTQIANRRGLMQAFEVEVAKLKRDGGELAIGLLDIDNFKRLNDELGHSAGDEALKSLAAVVTKTLRPGDRVARYGGEEFVVLLPQTAVGEGQAILTRLQRSLTGGLFMHKDEHVFVTFSAGVTGYRIEERIEDSLERADQALYEAKRTGKNRTCIG